MDITINRPRDGLHASQELIVRAAQEAKQLDDASVWILRLFSRRPCPILEEHRQQVA
jgi:hypothetical protein